MSNKKFVLFLVSVYFLGFILEYKIYPYMMSDPIFWERCAFATSWPPILIMQFIIVLFDYFFIGIAYVIDKYMLYAVFIILGVLIFFSSAGQRIYPRRRVEEM